MAHDEGLADRIKGHPAGQPRQDQPRMFSGFSFMAQGNLVCDVAKNGLCVWQGADGYEAALARPQVQPMDFTGKPMRGWVFVEAEALAEAASLHERVEMDLRHALCLPGK